MSTPAPKPPKPQSRFSRRALIIGGIILLFICGIIGTFLTQGNDPGSESEPAADVAEQPAATDELAEEPTEEPEPTETPSPTDTPAPTAAPTDPPEPTATLSPDEALRAAVTDALGTGNRDVERLASLEDANGRIEVDWAINDNLSEDLTRAGAQLDATEILRAIVESGYDYEFVLMRGAFPLVDAFGNVEETKVVELFFERPTVEQINWDNFSHRNIYDIADAVEIHPAFVRQ